MPSGQEREMNKMKLKNLRITAFMIVSLLFLGILDSCATTTNAAGSFYSNNAKDFRNSKLSNGIPVYFKQNHGSKIAVVKMIFEGGVPLYEGSIDGIEAFTLDFMLHGSKKYSYETLQQKQFENSFSIYSSASKDYSVAGFTCILRDIAEVTDMFADGILEPKFDEETFNRLRTEAETSIPRSKSDPSGVLGIELSKVAFKNHPYCVSSNVREETFSGLTFDSVKKEYESLMDSSRIKIIVVSDMNSEQSKVFVSLLDKYFGGMKKKSYAKPVIPSYKLEPSVTYKENVQAGDAGYMAGIFECPDRNSPEYIPFAISTMMLDDIFFDQVREKAGAVYSIGSGVVGGRHFLGAISIYKANNSKNLKEVVEAAINSFDAASVDETLDQYKNKYIATVFKTAANAGGIADNLIGSIEYYGNERHYLRRPEQVQSVTAKQVVAAYDKYIRSAVAEGKISWVVVGSKENLKTFGF